MVAHTKPFHHYLFIDPNDFCYSHFQCIEHGINIFKSAWFLNLLHEESYLLCYG